MTDPVVVQKTVCACDVGTMTDELVKRLPHEMSPLDVPISSSSGGGGGGGGGSSSKVSLWLFKA